VQQPELRSQYLSEIYTNHMGSIMSFVRSLVIAGRGSTYFGPRRLDLM